jgi:predicted Zn-dependent protease
MKRLVLPLLIPALAFPTVTTAAVVPGITAPAATATAPQRSSDLPDLGDNVTGGISPDQEYRVGRAWLRKLRGSTPSISDPVLQDYLEHLCYRLAFHSPLEHPDLSLIIIDDKQINAFAVPGGVIGINVGLILNADTEAEAAAVLAHELGHLSQRHYARQMADNKQNQWLYLGALLTSIAVAAKGNAEGAMALGLGSQAAMIDNQLSYSRLYEQEADRIGMQTLVDSGMDPHAMPEFFQKLMRETRQVGNVPEFVMTHPLTEARIADTINRANQYPQKLAEDSLDYQLARMRMLVAYMDDTGRGIAYFQQQLVDTPLKSDRGRINRFGLALAFTRARQYAKAHEALAPLLADDPERADYLVAEAEIFMAERNYAAAVALLQQPPR